jgi:hypothetical protein
LLENESTLKGVDDSLSSETALCQISNPRFMFFLTAKSPENEAVL